MRKLLNPLRSLLFLGLFIMITCLGRNLSANVKNDRIHIYDNKINIGYNITSKLPSCIPGTWLGTLSREWNDPSNWCNGEIPGPTIDVTINPSVNQPIINAFAECKNITLHPGATLTIKDTNTIKVYGHWSNYGSFISNNSTVILGGGIQNITGTSIFYNVNIGGTGRKNFSSSEYLIINGILSIEGNSASTLSLKPTYGPHAALRYNVSYSRATGMELSYPFVATGGVIIDNTGPIVISTSTTMDNGVPLTINSGATLIAIDKTITLGGDFHNYGNFNLNGTEIIIGSGTATQLIDGFYSNDAISFTKTGGIATFLGDVTGAGININGLGTLNLGIGLTHTFTGTWVRGNGTLNCGSSTLRFGSGMSGSNGLFIPENGTVEWFSSLPVSIYTGNYNNLIISGSGIKTAQSNIYINRILTIEEGAQFDQDFGMEKLLSINEEGKLNIYGTLRVKNNFPTNFTIFNNEGGTVEYYGTTTQSVYLFPYNNLILSGTIKKFIGPTQIYGNLTIRNGGTCNLSTYASSTNTFTIEDYGQVSGVWGGANSGAVFKNNIYFYNVSPGQLTVANNSSLPGLWTGKTSSDWGTASNWSDENVPTPISDAIITTNGISAVVNGTACCKNIYILPKCTLAINGNNSLSLTGDWVNQGTFIANSGTVIFNGGNQIVANGPYMNLTIGGSGVKTINNILVNGILSMEGTAVVSNTVGCTPTSTLQYNCTVPRTTGQEWPSTRTISEIIIKNRGAIRLSSSKIFNNTPLTIKEGATLDLGTYNITSLGKLNLECGGETTGSVITGTGKLTLGGMVTVTNSDKGLGAAVIDCPLATGSYSFNVSDGNPTSPDPTDLYLSNIASGSIIKEGGGTMSLKGAASLSSVTINAGNFTIQPLGMATLVGNLTNNMGVTGLTLLSDNTGTGSLIVNLLATGSAVVKRFITPGAWHLIASPLGGQLIQSFLNENKTIPTPLNGSSFRGMREYDPVNNLWGEFFTNTTAGNLVQGKGYCLRVMNSVIPHEVTFTGILQTGDKNIGNLSTGLWNCIGNPYTSSIGISTQGSGSNSTNFLSQNIANLDPAFGIYIWDKTDEANEQPGQYTVISNVPNPTHPYYYVQQGQGFMVKMATDKNSVSFTKAMQIHDPSITLKSAEEPWTTIQLMVKADSIKSSTLIAFHEGMTNGLDVSYDAGLLKGGSSIDLYTKLIYDYGIPFAIQALPSEAYEQLVIPVGVDYNKGGPVSFSAKGNYLPSFCQPILEDRLTGIFTNLSEKDYTINLTANSTGTGRFYLHTSYTTTKNNMKRYQPVFSARIVNKSKIIIHGNVGENAKATLLDIQGRYIDSWHITKGYDPILVITHLRAGMYILYIQDNVYSKAFKLMHNY